MERCDALGAVTDEPGQLTRTFLSPAMRHANALVSGWMKEAGLAVREDALSNLIGRWASRKPRARTFLLGSHLDTVRNAGKFDGSLGVLVALATVELLRSIEVEVPFNLEILGFSDEEGIRFQTTYLGSRAVAGTLTASDLEAFDLNGVALRDSGIENIKTARRKGKEIIGYAEVHIEQGPVLEAERAAVGVVTAIAGQTRARVEFLGRAAHAGTTPMHLRKDALAAAAEFIGAVEKRARGDLVATVGQLDVAPGASNVVPSRVSLSLDVRHQRDATRIAACRELQRRAKAIARSRKLDSTWTTVQETRTVVCDPALTRTMRESVVAVQGNAPRLASGAGHDAAAISNLCPVAMLFVRCKGGISHHPAESVSRGDVSVAIAALAEFLLRLKRQHE